MLKKIAVSLIVVTFILGIYAYIAQAQLPRIPTTRRPITPSIVRVYYNVNVNSGSEDTGAKIKYIQYNPENREAISGTGGGPGYCENGKTTLRLAAGKNWRILVYLAKEEPMHAEVPTARIDIPNLDSDKTLKVMWVGTFFDDVGSGGK